MQETRASDVRLESLFQLFVVVQVVICILSNKYRETNLSSFVY